MTDRNPPPPAMNDDPGIDEIALLFSISARQLADSPDRHAYLDWIADAGPLLAPGMAAGIDPRTGPVGNAFRAFGMEIYRAMPLPDNDFRRPVLPKTGRNERCPCGSGRKYKQCCQSLEGMLDLTQVNLLPYVLDALPRKTWATLPDTAVDLDMVGDTARQWLEEDEGKLAVALLEPWFTKKRQLTGRHALLFEMLMDAYLEQGNPRKRKRLLEDVIARGDRDLQATALQRQASILADQGDMAAAWDAFEKARRLNPDDLPLAPLEITLLMNRGEREQARNRARFWSARLRRNHNPDLADLIAFLDEVAADPDRAVASMARGMNPYAAILIELLESAPPPAAHYALQGGPLGDEPDDGMRCLAPDRRVAAVESTWQKVFPQIKPGLTATQHFDDSVWESAEDWLPVLESSPYAWQSFDILDDLAMAADALAIMGMDTSLLEPLLERGVALLEANLAAAGAQPITLPWGFLENRPALRLLAHHAFRLLEQETDNAPNLGIIRPAERLLALNPNDNHGLREHLARAYIACGAPARAVALSDRFPDDFCAMSLNRILALHRLDRLEEAGTALRAAAEHHGTAIRMLLADNPRQPRLSEHGITMGGKDEAWLYRQTHLHLWEQDGALRWLRGAWKEAQRQGRKQSGSD